MSGAFIDVLSFFGHVLICCPFLRSVCSCCWCRTVDSIWVPSIFLVTRLFPVSGLRPVTFLLPIACHARSSCSISFSPGSVPSLVPRPPFNIQPVVVVRGLKRQQAAALTNFVGCFLLALSFPFSLLLLSALNGLTGPSAGPLARIPYSIPFHHWSQSRSQHLSICKRSLAAWSPSWTASFACSSSAHSGWACSLPNRLFAVSRRSHSSRRSRDCLALRSLSSAPRGSFLCRLH